MLEELTQQGRLHAKSRFKSLQSLVDKDERYLAVAGNKT